MSSVRFTFISDRFNRTAIATLLAGLEDVVDDPHRLLKVVRLGELDKLGFGVAQATKEVLCLSTMTARAGAAVRIHRRLRERWGRVFTSICGGSHASGDPRNLLDAGIDYCCVGEGEQVIRAVYRRLVNREPLDTIEGLFSLRNGVMKGKRSTRRVDIERHSALPVRLQFPAHIEIGRGCRWACSYCQTPQVHGGAERYRSPRVVEEVVRRYAAFGMKDYRFLLPNTLGYMSETSGSANCEALEELLARSKAACGGGRLFLGSFPSEIRPDYVTEQALRVLKGSVSNSGLVIGGQSGSQRILDAVHRGHSVEDIRRACDISIGLGFDTSVDLVLGFPGEGVDDRAATLRLIEDLAAKGAVCNMHFFMPLPGTLLSAAEPVFLDAAERRRLDGLAQRGILRGRWRRQEETARKWLSNRGSGNPYR